ncbi:MAG: response regulator [Lachnospiraceae bacterium]
MKVLIADDESAVLEGLQYIIDWKKLGFSVCLLAKNGQEALDKIITQQPDLVLLDIRMPKLNGTEIVQIAREQGFSGHFIILSGYSDFTYAQTAIKYGVNFYLTKPIDEDELESSVISVKKQIEEKKNSDLTLSKYRENARDTIIRQLITGTLVDTSLLNLQDLNLSSDIYQIVIYERYTKDPFKITLDFKELLCVSNRSHNSFEHITIDHREIILLKGSSSIERFERLLSHYRIAPQKGSPLDALFLTYGRKVYQLNDIFLSYTDAVQLSMRRFFCDYNQHVLGFESLPNYESYHYQLSDTDALYYSGKLSGYIQAQNRPGVSMVLSELHQNLYHSRDEIPVIRRFLIDIYLQVKQTITHTYSNIQFPFPSNSAIIDLVEGKCYLYEIIKIMQEQAEMCMNAIGTPSSESIIDGIIHYINHNYQNNLKLESIAPLFGYNSSYLGKLFAKQVGEGFNSYLDRVRIENSKRLLTDETLKVYEISERVGYKTVDYFHKKFKKYTGLSPAEYRKQNIH